MKVICNPKSAWCPVGGSNFQHLTNISPCTGLVSSTNTDFLSFSDVTGDWLQSLPWYSSWDIYIPFLLAPLLHGLGTCLVVFPLRECSPSLSSSPPILLQVFFFFFFPSHWAAEVVPQWKFKHPQVSSQLSLCFLRLNCQFLFLQEILFFYGMSVVPIHSAKIAFFSILKWEFCKFKKCFQIINV